MTRLSRLGDVLAFLRAFTRTRWWAGFRDRASLLRWQKTQLDRFLAQDLGQIAYYKDLDRSSLTQLPVIHKAVMLASFERFNRYGLTLKRVLDIAIQAEQSRDFLPTLPAGISAGLSSGTSGQRGVFLASNRERSIWAGVILARVLSGQAMSQFLNPLTRPLRVALLLRANNNLYTSVHGWRVKFHFGDLLAPMENHLAMLNGLKPDILIAPASVLHALADAQQAGALVISPHQVISVAEVLESDDAQKIEQVWGLATDQIYQCTEGFLASTCRHGRLHLNEELVHFEMDWLDDAHTRFTPIITDFTRQTQAYVRYRLDDILQADHRPCTCGRVSLCIAAIEGRQDDVLWLPARDSGALRAVFPDLIRRAMAMAQTCTDHHEACFTDYRLIQSAVSWCIRFKGVTSADLASAAVVCELQSMCEAVGLVMPKLRFEAWVDDAPAIKRRRIQCQQKPGQESGLI